MSRAVLDRVASLDAELNYGDLAFPRYSTATQIARWAGTDARWVQRQVRRGVTGPTLLKGERQFDRPGALRLLLLAKLQGIFGETSPIPFKIVEAAGPAIDDLLKNPSAGTLLVLRNGGPFNLVVSVPGLGELLAGAA